MERQYRASELSKEAVLWIFIQATEKRFLFFLIRFWTMANTFTGLKLQGQIGKFGAKELSDVEGWCLLCQFFYRVEFFLGGGREVGGEWRHKGLKCEKCLWKVKT